MKNILFFGENVEVHNLLQYVKKGQYYQTTHTNIEVGGIQRLSKIIIELLKVHGIEINGKTIICEKQLAKLLNTYEPYPINNSNDETYVWRIKNQIGKEISQDPTATTTSYNIDSFLEEDFVIVYDDNNLSKLISHENGIEKKTNFLTSFEKAVSNQNCKHIFLKTTFHYEKRDVIEIISKANDNIKKTVILDSSQLRKRNISINANISWDHCIDTVFNEFYFGFINQWFREFDNLFIYFKTAGVLLIEPKKSYESNKMIYNLFYDRKNLDGTWNRNINGKIHGDLEILTSLIISSLFLENTNKFITINRAINLIRKNYVDGKASFKSSLPDYFLAFNAIHKNEHNQKQVSIDNLISKYEKIIKDNESIDLFCLLNNYDSCDYYNNPNQNDFSVGNDIEFRKSNILNNVTGAGYENVIAKGMQIIENGFDSDLLSVPYLQFGSYTTFDKNEICQLNTINNIILNYIDDDNKESKPLSIAVFGSPGSGKSHIIKELIKNYEQRLDQREFNLSQLKNYSDIFDIFQDICNPSSSYKIPFVFWDEFDTDKLACLKYFLQPMQDGFFTNGPHRIYFKKAIFVFCGSMAKTYEEFCYKLHNFSSTQITNENLTEEQKKHYQKDMEQKTSDFISRIKAFLDIQNLNPKFTKKDNEVLCIYENAFNYDYILRRAILLRSTIESKYKNLIDRSSNKINMSYSIMQAMLRSQEFKYGARSINNLLTISNINNVEFFGESNLPPYHLIEHLVSNDFFHYLEKYKFDSYLLGELTVLRHNIWKEQKISEGYKVSDRTKTNGKILHINNDSDKTHNNLIDFCDLDIYDKYRNYRTTWSFIGNLFDMGIILERKNPFLKSSLQGAVINLDNEGFNEVKEKLIELEHEKYLEEHKPFGWIKIDNNDNDDINQKFLHSKNITKYNESMQNHKDYLLKLVDGTIEFFNKKDFTFLRSYNYGYHLLFAILSNEMIKNDELTGIIKKIKSFHFHLLKIFQCSNNKIQQNNNKSLIDSLHKENFDRNQIHLINICSENFNKKNNCPIISNNTENESTNTEPNAQSSNESFMFTKCNFIINNCDLIFLDKSVNFKSNLVIGNNIDSSRDVSGFLKRTVNNMLEYVALMK